MTSVGCGLKTELPTEISAASRNSGRPWKAFGHAVMEGTMAQSEGGRSPAERGVGIVVLVFVTP